MSNAIGRLIVRRAVRNLLSVKDIENSRTATQALTNIYQVRKNIKIVVIDDKEFTPLENLKRHNYNIHPFKDISSLDFIEPYQIILCDLNGVGLSFDPTYQGAQVIKQIKTAYPEKVVIAYTGGADSAILERAIRAADAYLKKDAAIEEWCDQLDDAIYQVTDPVLVWRKLTHRLVGKGTPTRDIAILESRFVEAVLSGRGNIQAMLIEEANELKIADDVKSIIRSVIGSAIFEVLKSM